LTTTIGPRGGHAQATGRETLRHERRYRLAVIGLGLLALAMMAWLFVRDPSLYQRVLFAWGIGPFRYPFLDWEYLPASASCWRQGVNVYVATPCDVLNRPHNYSPLWLRAWFLPTGPFWRNVFGLGIALSFFASAWLVIRPKSWREALVFAGAILSTTIVFLLERGNIDAIMFAMLALATVICLPRGFRSLSYGLIMIAGVLKFYPLAAMSLALREKPRVFWTVAVASTITLALYYLWFRTELHDAFRNVPAFGYAQGLFGANNLPVGLAVMITEGRFALVRGTPSTPPLLFGALATALAAASFAGGYLVYRSRQLHAAYDRMGERDRLLLAAGSALIVGCFYAGQSSNYRGVILIFVLAGLLALRREVAAGAMRGLLTGVIAATVFLMWDGMFRHALLAASLEHLRTTYWVVREVLWRLLVAFLIGAFALFASRSPVLAPIWRRLPGGRGGRRPTERQVARKSDNGPAPASGRSECP
jgi:hypothetical protein